MVFTLENDIFVSGAYPKLIIHNNILNYINSNVHTLVRLVTYIWQVDISISQLVVV